MTTSRRRRWLAILGLLLVLLLLAWFIWPDRTFARAKQLQKELSDPAARQLTSDERRRRSGAPTARQRNA